MVGDTFLAIQHTCLLLLGLQMKQETRPYEITFTS
jgi:hypothetical protein